MLYDSAKELLLDRSETRYESMRWIDGETGKVIAAFDSMGRTPILTGKDHELKVEYGAKTLHKLKGYKNIVVIHNHPNSSAPSAGDFNSAYNHGYALGFVVTHNGRLFKYTSEEEINEAVYDMNWQDFYHDTHDDVMAQILTIEKIALNAKVTLKEVNSHEMV